MSARSEKGKKGRKRELTLFAEVCNEFKLYSNPEEYNKVLKRD